MDSSYSGPHRTGGVWPGVMALLFTLAGLVFAALASVLLAAVPAAGALLAVEDPLSTLLLGLRWVLLAGAVLVALGALYRYGPNRRSARLAWVTPGSILATAVWLLASWGFGRYVANFGSYNETFRSEEHTSELQSLMRISYAVFCLKKKKTKKNRTTTAQVYIKI